MEATNTTAAAADVTARVSTDLMTRWTLMHTDVVEQSGVALPADCEANETEARDLEHLRQLKFARIEREILTGHYCAYGEIEIGSMGCKGDYELSIFVAVTVDFQQHTVCSLAIDLGSVNTHCCESVFKRLLTVLPDIDC